MRCAGTTGTARGAARTSSSRLFFERRLQLDVHEILVGSSWHHILTCEANGGDGRWVHSNRARRLASMSGADARGMCSRVLNVTGADRRMGSAGRSNGRQGRVECIGARAAQLGGGGGVRTEDPGRRRRSPARSPGSPGRPPASHLSFAPTAFSATASHLEKGILKTPPRYLPGAGN